MLGPFGVSPSTEITMHWTLLDAVLILGLAALVVILWPEPRGPR